MKQILIIEDDKNLNNGIKIALRNDYICLQAFLLQTARDILKMERPELILLDVNLPDGSGIDLMAEIRRFDRTPIILLTANNMEMDIVTGLESGANDYITKPFSLMVLRARVGVQLREGKDTGAVFKCGEYCFDFEKMEFMKGSRGIDLSKTEQRLLRCLVEHKGKNVSRSRLIDSVWQGETEFVDEHALTVAVNRLRNKLGDSPSAPECILSLIHI